MKLKCSRFLSQTLFAILILFCLSSCINRCTNDLELTFTDGYSFESNEYSKNLVFQYEENADTFSIVGYSGNNNILVIPSSYNARPVTRIIDLSNPLDDSFVIGRLYIPSSVLSIEVSDSRFWLPPSHIYTNHHTIPEGWNQFFDYHYPLVETAVYSDVTTVISMHKQLTSLDSSETIAYDIINNEFCMITSYSFYQVLSVNEVLLNVSTIPDYLDGFPVKWIGGFLKGPSAQNIQQFIFPSSVTHIYESAFKWNYDLIIAELPESLLYLGARAFYSCHYLEYVGLALPSGIEYIGEDSFNGTGIVGIQIPDSVRFLGNGAFASTRITSFNFPAGLTNIPSGLLNATLIENLQIIDSIKTIESFSLANTTRLTKISLPASVQHIQQYSFYRSRLYAIYIPSSVFEIEDSAFKECSMITIFTDATELPIGWSKDFNDINVRYGSTFSDYLDYII